MASEWTVLAWSKVGPLDNGDEYPELPELEVIPPHTRPILSTARLARPAGAKLLVRLIAVCRNDMDCPELAGEDEEAL
jgi:hypothetical protein